MDPTVECAMTAFGTKIMSMSFAAKLTQSIPVSNTKLLCYNLLLLKLLNLFSGLSSSPYSNTGYRVLIHNVSCLGNEIRLTACNMNLAANHFCPLLAAIQCNEGKCKSLHAFFYWEVRWDISDHNLDLIGYLVGNI